MRILLWQETTCNSRSRNCCLFPHIQITQYIHIYYVIYIYIKLILTHRNSWWILREPWTRAAMQRRFRVWTSRGHDDDTQMQYSWKICKCVSARIENNGGWYKKGKEKKATNEMNMYRFSVTTVMVMRETWWDNRCYSCSNICVVSTSLRRSYCVAIFQLVTPSTYLCNCAFKDR